MTLKSDFGRSVSRFQLHIRTYYTLMQRLLSSDPLEAETLQLSTVRGTGGSMRARRSQHQVPVCNWLLHSLTG